MYERDADTGQIEFQWSVGDTRDHEENLRQIIRPEWTYATIFAARLVALGLTFVVANALLEYVDFFAVLAITLTASLSIWVSIGLEIFVMRVFERLSADDPRRVGWNAVWLDSSGVTWSTETSVDYTSWLGVTDVIEKNGSLWIRTGSAHGYFLPSRIFASNDELSDCRKLIQLLREQPLPPSHLVDAGEGMVKH